MNANEISSKAGLRMTRIQNVSAIFRTIFLAVAILYAVGGLVLYLPGLFSHGSPKSDALNAISEFANAVWAWCCYKLFNRYSHGELFTPQIVSSIRRVGYMYFATTVVGGFSRINLLHTMQSNNWHPALTNFSWAWLSLLCVTAVFPGFLIIFIAWIMDEGRKIQEEQELTV